jgi:hypothetical protein
VGYSIEIDEAAQATFAVLPRAALRSLAEAFTVLELEPWSGSAVNPQLNPDGPVRNLPFGVAGMLTYLILEDQQRVDVLLVTWAA